MDLVEIPAHSHGIPHLQNPVPLKDVVKMSFPKLMASPLGRLARAVAGLALIVAGAAMHSAAGWGVALVGLVPLAAGLFDWCPLGRIFGAPFRGRDIRKA